MSINDALYVSGSITNSIMKKLDSSIGQKQILSRKLTPYLFHEITDIKINSNIGTMILNSQKQPTKIVWHDQSTIQPSKLKRDNMNPKSIVYQQSICQQTFQPKRSRRLTFSTKKSSFTEVKTSRQQITGNGTSDRKISVHLHSFSLKQNQSLQLSSPRLKNKFSRNINEPIKLLQKKQSQNSSIAQIEDFLRLKKIKEQQEKALVLQLECFKSKRLEKLKQKIVNQENNGQMISFDFDGSVINLDEEETEDQISLKPDKFSELKKPVRYSFQRNTTQNNKNLKQTDSSIIKSQKKNQSIYSQNHGTTLPFQTLYKVYEMRQSIEFNENHSNFFQQNKSSSKQSKNLSTPNKSSIRSSQLPIQSGQKDKESTISLFSLKEASLNGSQILSKQCNHGKVKIFRDTSSAQKNLKISKALNEAIQQKQQEYSNNFRRQTSTIPYLQIHQGICYKEEIKANPFQKNNQTVKIRYASIQKPRNNSQKSISDRQKSIHGNKTFRSYLPFTQVQKTHNNFFNQTISVFSQIGDKALRLGLSRQNATDRVGKHHEKTKDSNELDQFAIFDNPTFKLIKDHKNSQANHILNTDRPKTTNAILKANFHQTTQQKTSKKTNILDIKQKIIQRQKQRVMSSYTAREK